MGRIIDAIHYSSDRFGRTFNYYWVIIPIWGWFVVYGWVVHILNEIRGGNNELPSIKPFTGLFKTGALFFVVNIIWMAVFFILMIIPILGWLALSYLMFLIPILTLQFAETQKISAGLNFVQASKTLFGNFSAYIRMAGRFLAIYLPIMVPYYILSISRVFTDSLIVSTLYWLMIVALLIVGPAFSISITYVLGDYWREVSPVTKKPNVKKKVRVIK